jgi:hypothetical protein
VSAVLDKLSTITLQDVIENPQCGLEPKKIGCYLNTYKSAQWALLDRIGYYIKKVPHVIGGPDHRVLILIEMKQGECICPLSWSVHSNFVRDGSYSERGKACSAPPPSLAWANFSIKMECTPEGESCHSVCTLWSRPPARYMDQHTYFYGYVYV